MNSKDFFLALEDLEQTKGIKKELFLSALQTALVNAYKRNTGTQKAVDVILTPERNKIKLIAYQTVVEEVTDKETQISLEDARLIDRKYKVGDIVSEEIQSKEFGRIAAQTAKQIVMQKLREIEGEKAIAELGEKEEQLVSCVVRRIDGKNVYVELNKIEACLEPKDLMPSDRFREGDRIKVYVKKIKVGPRGPQILLSRTAPGFVRRLLEIEIPELAQGVVEIKAIAREAGYRTKLAVVSNDEQVDAVGAVVGNRGVRVNSVVSELNGEKIDIIPWCSDILEFIARSLNPAKVVMVQVNDDEKSAKVAVLDEMLSLAIGRDGQNARLAARLTGWKIDVKPYSKFESEKSQVEEVKAVENAKNSKNKVVETKLNSLDNEDDLFEEGLGELE